RKNRFDLEDRRLAEEEKRLELARKETKGPKGDENDQGLSTVKAARGLLRSYEEAGRRLNRKELRKVQAGNWTAVDVAVCINNLRSQDRLTPTANRDVLGRNFVDIGGVWIDDDFRGTMKTLVIKAQSDAYFQVLMRNPRMKDVFRLGNHLVFVT